MRIIERIYIEQRNGSNSKQQPSQPRTSWLFSSKLTSKLSKPSGPSLAGLSKARCTNVSCLARWTLTKIFRHIRISLKITNELIHKFMPSCMSIQVLWLFKRMLQRTRLRTFISPLLSAPFRPSNVTTALWLPLSLRLMAFGIQLSQEPMM